MPPTLECINSIIIMKVGRLVFDQAIKAGKYVVDYTTNLEKLKHEMIKLKDHREIIEEKVREAYNRGEVVYMAVSDWRQDADKITNDVERLSSGTENIRCFIYSCPNVMRRYRLSKQAEKKIEVVRNLILESNFKGNEISHPRSPPPELEFPSNKNYIRTPVFERIVDALKDPRVNVIGIHGLGGIGKTTLAVEVGKEMRQGGIFKQVAVVVVSTDLNVRKIQAQLADSLYFKLDATYDQKGRATQLWNKFTNGERYLVILDDIWTKVDIQSIGIPLTKGLTTGCKVVLTSRNEDLLVNRMNVDKAFPAVERLEEPEAWSVFKEKVGDSIDSQPELHSLASELFKKCEGVPLAINALGEALKGKPINELKHALIKLEEYMNIEEIYPSGWASLRLSYDMLWSSDAKSCFLLCCLFAKDVQISIDDLMRHCVAKSMLSLNRHTLDEARNTMHTVVDHLKSASFLSIGDHENVVKIHDVIRALGISIARNQEEAFLVKHGVDQWPRNPTNEPLYSAISISFNDVKMLPDGLVYPKLHTLMVYNRELSDVEFPDNFFDGMMQLTVLTITRMRIRRLPSSLAKLINLRMLDLNECQLDDISILKDLKSNLEVLSLRDSHIKVLPQEIKQLTSLRVLDLQDCKFLMIIPRGVISNLTNLEELYFPSYFKEWKAKIDEQQDKSRRDNVSLEEVWRLLNYGRLTTLQIHIPDVDLLPKEDLIFAKLKGFRISVGSAFDDSLSITPTCMLKLEGIQLRNELISLVDNAEVLVLERIQFTVYPFRLFNKLTVLIIEEFEFKYLFTPTTARGLVHLEELRVESCEFMEGIIGFEGHNDENEIIREVKFSKLKKLELNSLPNLISFYAKKEKNGTTKASSSTHAQPLFNEKVLLPVLEVFEVDGLGNIVEIWDKQSPWLNENIVSLRDVKIQHCNKLMNLLPSNIIQNLQKLSVEGCPKIVSVVFKNEKDEIVADDTTLTIPQLWYLRMSDMENLKSFYSSSSASSAQSLFNNQVILPVLEVFEVDRLGNILEIWEKQSPPVNENTVSGGELREVKVQRCNELTNLVPSNMLPRLKNLKKLCVEGCPKIESVVFKNGNEAAVNDSPLIVPQLWYLRISDMENLISFYSSSTASNAQSLFSHQVMLPALEVFLVDRLGNIEEIWDKQSPMLNENTLPSFKLRDLKVQQCEKLTNLVPSIIVPRLPHLRNVHVEGCPNIESIVFKMADDSSLINKPLFPCLSKLELSHLQKLKMFCHFTHPLVLPLLGEMVIYDCPSLNSFSAGHVSIPNLSLKGVKIKRMRNQKIGERKYPEGSS